MSNNIQICDAHVRFTEVFSDLCKDELCDLLADVFCDRMLTIVTYMNVHQVFSLLYYSMCNMFQKYSW